MFYECCESQQISFVACRNALAQLLTRNPEQVVLRPNQWNIPPQDLLDNMPGADPMHQALPVHVASRSQANGAWGATLSPTERDARVTDIVRKCLRLKDGCFEPNCIPRRFYTALDQLLLPEGLKPFIEGHPEFDWKPIPGEINKFKIKYKMFLC